MNRIIAIITICSALLFNCKSEEINQNVIENNEPQTISVTQYSDNTEIFMEYPALVVNEEAKFLIHLTDLKNFSAVNTGVLTVKFYQENNEEFSVQVDKPARAGIFIPTVKFTRSGIYKMVIDLEGEQVKDKIIVNNVEVYPNQKSLPMESETSSSSISFLKEQQWKIDFANEPVQLKILHESILVNGEIIPKPEMFSKVVSPIQGIVLAKNNSNLTRIGNYVKKGGSLLNISPSADASENIQRIKSEYFLAKSEYERIKELHKKEIATEKDLDEIKSDYEAKQASYYSLIDQIKITENGYSVIAPIDGFIENVNFNLGDQLESGQELFTILNPTRIVVKLNVQSVHFQYVEVITDAIIKPEGIKSEYLISNLNGTKLSTPASISRKNRTIPVYFELDNPSNLLRIGMFCEANLRIGKKSKTVAVKESAIINEDGLQTVYVQTEGEAFEKRIIKTGIVDNGYVQVLDGLEIDERIVTLGAYQVRLAALSPESAIGHGHAH